MINQKIFSNTKEKNWAIILLVISFIYLFIIVFLSKGLYGDADSMAHYMLARHAFLYPHHLVDHWGKPLYTTLCVPFAQFGFRGALLFNILSGLFTAWFCYLIAKELNFRYALLAIPFTLFSPIYMVTMMTCLTEILFTLVLVSAIYFFLKKKSIASALIISFIPFARTEGLMFIALFLLAFLLMKQYKAIPFLLAGFIIFSLAGYFHYKDVFWFFTTMPYGAEGSMLYGSGSFFYYLDNFGMIMGKPLIILALSGFAVLIFQLFTKNKPGLTSAWITQYFLVSGSFVAFFLIHSFLWYKGLMGVLASQRFMACIMPLGGLMALAGVNFGLSFFKEKKRIIYPIMVVITALVIITPYRYHEIPSKLVWASQVMKETADALKKLGYEGKRIVFFDPKLTFYLDEDPYDRERFRYRIPDSRKPETNMPDSSYLIWDTHGGGLEKRIKLEEMLVNPNFKLLDGFVPDEEHILEMVGMNYMSMIFMKLPPKYPQNEWIRIDSCDFESASDINHRNVLTDKIFFSGMKSNFVDSLHRTGIPVQKTLAEISSGRKVILRSRIRVYIPGNADPDKLLLVFEVRNKAGQVFRYVVIHASYFKPKPDKWVEIASVIPLHIDFPEDGYLKCYLLNTGIHTYYSDDLVLEYLPVNY